jgi:hypothetical protein
VTGENSRDPSLRTLKPFSCNKERVQGLELNLLIRRALGGVHGGPHKSLSWENTPLSSVKIRHFRPVVTQFVSQTWHPKSCDPTF